MKKDTLVRQKSGGFQFIMLAGGYQLAEFTNGTFTRRMQLA